MRSLPRFLLAWVSALALLALSAPARAGLVFESSTLGQEGITAGLLANSTQWLGVRFTLTAQTHVTWIGAHYWMNGSDGFIAIFPIDAMTGEPPEPKDINDAMLMAALPEQGTSADTGVGVDITLPAGDYALVVGSTDVFSTGGVTVNNTNIDSPHYLVAAGSSWVNAGLNNARFFVGTSVCGDATVEPPEQCEDGNQDNTDACLNTCLDATCGDGFVQAGVEQCDEGQDNGTGSCSIDCMIVSGQGGAGQGGAAQGGQGGLAAGGSGQGGQPMSAGGGSTNATGPGSGGATATSGTGASQGGAGVGGADSGAEPGESGGCGCELVGAQRPEGSDAPWLVAFLCVAVGLRRARSRQTRQGSTSV